MFDNNYKIPWRTAAKKLIGSCNYIYFVTFDNIILNNCGKNNLKNVKKMKE